jgi:hypothetical protein
MNEENRVVENDEEVEEVEIEEFAKRGEKPPRAKRYIIRVDKDKFPVDTPTIKGAAILALAGKTPDKFKLYQHERGHQPILIQPTADVDLTAPGVERFTTMPKDTTEGRTDAALELRHEFTLQAADEEYLDGLGLPWETVKDAGILWLLIHDWKVPRGYTLNRVSVALLIPPAYADAQIDMVYFKPALTIESGKTIKNLSAQIICGETWQGWSRHRTAENPWRIGVDDVATHLTLVDEWLRREVGA